MSQDELATRRWFRNRLKAIATQHPELKKPERQARLEAELKRQPQDEHEENTHEPETNR